jgi:hypothetical protein
LLVAQLLSPTTPLVVVRNPTESLILTAIEAERREGESGSPLP